jgi:dTDP-4-dehydrorhamnose 3,5-epimerase
MKPGTQTAPLPIDQPLRGQPKNPERKKMNFIKTDIAGVWVIEPSPHRDERGRFMRAWCAREFQEHGLEFSPAQANLGFSRLKGTVRGLHFQEAPALEAKLVRCTRGAIFDVAVDLRPGSASYGKWYGTELSAENGRMLYVPEQCAHGYQTLEDDTEMYYMASQFYTPEAARGVAFDDPFLKIQWPLTVTVVSEQDRNWPTTRFTGDKICS